MAERFRRGEEVRGMGFPIEKGREGYWPRRNANALRQSSILMILGTVPGERLMLPEFGSRLAFLVFEPNDSTTVEQIKNETAGALARWDPYISVIAVAPEIEQDTVRIYIDYVDRRDPRSQPRRMTFSSGR
jgi:hypothetical protein